MPTYIDTSGIAVGNAISANDVKIPLEDLDTEIASINAARTAVSTGASDAGKIVELNGSGVLDASLMPGVDWDAWKSAVRDENLAFNENGLVYGYGTNKFGLWRSAVGMDGAILATGAAQVDGVRLVLSDHIYFLLSPADATYARYDIVVLRRDTVSNVISCGVVTGTPAASPAVPGVASNELALWRLYVPAGTTTCDATTYLDMRDFNINAPPTGFPAGMVVPYAGASAPSGWLLAIGQTVSRTTYADLFAAIGTAYGAGDGSTTFKLPDLRGRFPLGADNMGGTSVNRVTATQADTLGQAAGFENHTLSLTEIPSHAHTWYKPFNTGGERPTTGTGSNWNPGEANLTSYEGGGAAHNNMPPYQTYNYIIKI